MCKTKVFDKPVVVVMRFTFKGLVTSDRLDKFKDVILFILGWLRREWITFSFGRKAGGSSTGNSTGDTSANNSNAARRAFELQDTTDVDVTTSVPATASDPRRLPEDAATLVKYGYAKVGDPANSQLVSDQVGTTMDKVAVAPTDPDVLDQSTTPVPGLQDRLDGKTPAPGPSTKKMVPAPSSSSSDDDSMSSGAIAGIVIGAIAVLGMIGGAAMMAGKKKQQPKFSDTGMDEDERAQPLNPTGGPGL